MLRSMQLGCPHCDATFVVEPKYLADDQKTVFCLYCGRKVDLPEGG